jgi:ABC-2 type transport system permease protein
MAMTDPTEPVVAAERVAPTRRGQHHLLATLAPIGAPVRVDLGRTLRLRVEFSRQLRRRRTQIAGLVLLVLPILVAIAFQVGGADATSDAGGGAALVGIATVGAGNFTLFTEFASVGFLLVVIVALFCGDTVASEASWASLRYLLAAPIPRGRLLRQKLIVALVLSFGANLVLPAWSYLIGGLFFGWAPVRSPLGGTFSTGEALTRLAIVIGYACLQSLIVAGLAYLFGVLTDAPLGAVGGATLLIVVSNILDSITALGSYRNYLPTHFQFSWLDALGPSVVWDDMIRGTGVALVYAAVLFALAWSRFQRKDITS